MMESIQLLVLAFALLFLVYFFRKRHQHLPPSPPGSLPLIGHILLIGKQPPHQIFRKLAKQYGGLMYLKLGSNHTLIASTPAAAKQVLKNHDRDFASRPTIAAAKYLHYNATDMIFIPYGDLYNNLRKLCNQEIFTQKRLEMLLPLRTMERVVFVKELLNASKSNTEVNMSKKITDVTFNTMTRIVMNKSFSQGSPEEINSGHVFKEAVIEGLHVGAGVLGDFIPWLKWMDWREARLKELGRIQDVSMQKALLEHKERRANGAEPIDFMDVMLSFDMDDTLVKAVAGDILSAGMDTSAITVEWGLSEVVRNPHVLAAIRHELDTVVGNKRMVQESDMLKLKYLEAVVKETLRLHPPTPLLLPRKSSEVCRIGDFVLPANTNLFVNAYAIGRDENTWSQADKFDPERFLGDNCVDVKGQDFEVIPFGSGRRMCPAVGMGLSTVQSMLASLLHAFEWKLPGGLKPQELDMNEAYGATLPRANPLILLPSTRLPAEAYTW